MSTTALQVKTSQRKIQVVELLEKNKPSADPDNPHHLVCACVYEVRSVQLWTVNSLITVLSGYVSSSSLREAKMSGVFTPYCQS